MKKIFILLSFLLFINLSSQLKLGRYANTCYAIDAPASILLLKKNSKFLLMYPSSVEQFSGTWVIKKDTLFLASQYYTSGKDDSIPVNEKQYFIVKRKRLMNSQNEKCFLIFKK